MAKYYGEVGFAFTIENPADSGIWVPTIVKKNYSGDVLDNTKRADYSDNVNPDLRVTNRISIVANPYAMQNYHSIAYVKYRGNKWKVLSTQEAWPRLILNLGGLYNGEDETGSSQLSEDSDN